MCGEVCQAQARSLLSCDCLTLGIRCFSTTALAAATNSCCIMAFSPSPTPPKHSSSRCPTAHGLSHFQFSTQSALRTFYVPSTPKDLTRPGAKPAGTK